MNHPDKTGSQSKKISSWKNFSVAALASTVLLGGYIAEVPAIAGFRQIAQSQHEWQPILNIARLTRTNQLVLQLDLLDKPATSYANVAYYIYARRNSQWVQVLTNTGARMITDRSGRVTLAPELFPIDELQRRLGRGIDLSREEFKVVTLLRYDPQGGPRRQTIQFERVLRYATIAQTNTTQIATYTSSSQMLAAQETVTVINPGTQFVTQPISAGSVRREQSRFSLAILQKRTTLSNVIARISLKPRRSQGFLAEEFIGDFRYKLKEKKHKAKFIKGLYAGDRVIVRLFTPDNHFIGYSEFELLSSNTVVTLVLPDRPAAYGIVRTIYGVDRDEDYAIDRNVQIYDYYTQITQVQNYQESRVTFLDSLQTSLLSSFDISGFPTPRPTCSYPTSFRTGSYTLVNQVIRVFSSNLTPALVSFPGQVVQVNNISTTNVSTYEVRQQIVNYQRIGATPGTVVYSSDDGWEDDRKPRKTHCNQGIGNGSEGCDPGNSHPHGGSNDEYGRSSHGRGKH